MTSYPSSTDEAMSRLRADLRTLIHDTEDLLRSTAHQTGEQAERLRARLDAALQSAKTSFHSLEQRALAASRAADDAVRTHPYATVGMAFAAGLALGVVLGRR